MSATNRGAVRLKNDAYYTPDDVAEACVNVLLPIKPSWILEPSVGNGAFVRAARKRWPSAHVTGVDVDRNAAGLAECQQSAIHDFMESGPTPFLGGPRYDLILGNPPYVEAEEHVRHALSLKPHWCAFLLRLGFLESCKRKPFWDEHRPASVYALRRRPSFTGGGTDASAYGWFVWDMALQYWEDTTLGWLET